MRFRIKNIKNKILRIEEFFLFKLTRKDSNSVFFYPHPNCRTDKYDVIKYYSDNVLCLLNYLIEHHKYDYLQLYVLVYDGSKVNDYIEYVRGKNGNIKICFVLDSDRRRVIKYASKSSIIFTDTGHTFFRYKTPMQQLICLNYFVPFKNDYILDKKQREDRVKINNIFDAFLMTAPLPARVSACDKGIALSNFLLLGFCRNDVFYNDPKNTFKQYLSEFSNKIVKQFIVYTPTYRDYEVDQNSIIRDIFGYDGSEYEPVETILEQHQAVLIAKLHPKQTNIRSKEKKTSRIFLYNELNNNPFSLYEVLAEADGLITDYTSTYFDFLHRNKPVIFNFYDFDLYKNNRGFGFEPIDVFCAGDIVNTPESFVKSISDVLSGKDAHYGEREKILPVFDSYYDGNNTKRVCEYFFK